MTFEMGNLLIIVLLAGVSACAAGCALSYAIIRGLERRVEQLERRYEHGKER